MAGFAAEMSSAKTFSNTTGDSIDCPECGADIRRLCDLEIYADDESTDVECEGCCAIVTISVRLTKSYVATTAQRTTEVPTGEQ